jgi:hypothetical protein
MESFDASLFGVIYLATDSHGLLAEKPLVRSGGHRE